MAIEVYFGFNFYMDLVLLLACGRISARCGSLKRLCAAAGAGALLACLATHPALSVLVSLPGKCLTVPLMLAIAFGKSSARSLVSRSLLFFGLSALCAGIAAALMYAGYAAHPGCFTASLALIACAFGENRRPLRDFRVILRVGKRSFCALMDTGNLLREPISGLPCVVAGEALFALGDTACTRTVRLRTAAGSCNAPVRALRDVTLEYGGERYRIPWTWVCQSPRTLQDGLDAVVPPWPYIRGSYEYDLDRKSA